MITRDELREALAGVKEMLLADGEDRLLNILMDSKALYDICSQMIPRLADYELSERLLDNLRYQAKVAERCEPDYSEDHYRQRFILMRAMTFGAMVGFAVRDVQHNYKPPQPRDQTRRRRR